MESLTLTTRSTNTGPLSAAFKRTLRVRSADLLEGMYVSDLDRPWLDTPFLLEGFRIDCQQELDTLRQTCVYVHVDRDLSDPILTRHLAQLEQRDSASRDTPLNQAPRRTPRQHHLLSAATRQHFRTLLAGHVTPSRWPWLLRPWRALLQHLRPTQTATRTPHTGAARTTLLPPGIPTTAYAPSGPLSGGLPQARQAILRSVHALSRLYAALRQGTPRPWQAIHACCDELVACHMTHPDSLLWAVQTSAPCDALHRVRVAVYQLTLGRHLGLPQTTLRHLAQIGLLADVGKTRLPRSLLDKPGMLSPAEMHVMRQHVRHSLDILQDDATLAPEVLTGIAQRHERFDGSGYPHGLTGPAISPLGHITAMVDVLTALVTPRPYAHEVSAQEALMSLYEWAGRTLNLDWVEALVHALGVFPVGHLVELHTGEIAAVTQHHPDRPAEPSVLILTNEAKRALPEPIAYDLVGAAATQRTAQRGIMRGLPAGAYGLTLPAHPPL